MCISFNCPDQGKLASKQVLFMDVIFFEDDLIYSKINLKQMNQLEKTIGDHQKKLLAKYRAWHGFEPYKGPRGGGRQNHPNPNNI